MGVLTRPIVFLEPYVPPTGISVAQYAEVASWFSATTPRNITGVSWSAGDIIVVAGGSEGIADTLGTPTNASLTFALQVSTSLGGAFAYMWTATAASTQSAQTIAGSRSAGAGQWGINCWVITGSPSGLGVSFANGSNAATSLTTAAGSVVCYFGSDFNATNNNETPATGSGTATERADIGNGTNYGVYAAEWVGTSAGSATYGLASYTGWAASQVAIEVLA